MWLKLLVALVPLLAFPVALIWGLRKTLWAVLAVVALIAIGPFVYFTVGTWVMGGTWAQVKETAGLMLSVMQTVAVIGGWMVIWALVYGSAGAAIRFG